MAGYQASYLAELAAEAKRAEDQGRARELDPDLAGPIAAMPAATKVLAALIEPDARGRLSFSGDFRVQVFPARERELRLDGTVRSSTRRFEVKTAERSARKLSVVVASHPYSVDWIAIGKFKRERPHRDNRKIEENIRELLDGDGDVWSAVNSLSFDYFEKQKIWTAVLEEPRRVAVEAVVGRAGTKNDLQQLFGLCEDPQACVAQLKRETSFLLDQTRDGSLFTRHEGGSAVVHDLGFSDEFLARAEATLEGCLWTALAGPVEEVAKLDEAQRSVADLAQKIYLARANAAAKRHARAQPLGPFEELVERIEHELEDYDGDKLGILENALELIESRDVESRIFGLATIASLRNHLPAKELAKPNALVLWREKNDEHDHVRHAAAAALRLLKPRRKG